MEPALGKVTFTEAEIGGDIGGFGNGTSRNMFFYGGYLYANYRIWDMSNPRNPQAVDGQSNWASLNMPHIFTWSEDILVSDSRIHDMSNILRPVELSRFTGPLLFKSLQWPYLHRAGAYNDAYIVEDISNPSNPQRVLSGFNPVDILGFPPGAMHHMGNLMVISSGDRHRGMSTWDISDPLNPQLIDTTGTQGPGMYFSFMYGNHVYSSGPVSGRTIGVWRINDDFTLTFLGQQNPPGMGDYIWFWEGYGFGQEPDRGLGNRWGKLPLDTIYSNPVLAASGNTYTGNRRYGIPMGNMVGIAGNNDGSNRHYLSPHQTAPDNNPPVRLWTVPLDGAVNQALTSRIGVSMNEEIDDRTVSDQTFVVRPVGGNPIAGRISMTGQGLMNFTPAQPLQNNTTYEVVIVEGGMWDLSGNGAVGSITRFSTGSSIDVDGFPTAILQATPTAGDMPLDVQFDASQSFDEDGSIASYFWIFGDGNTASGQTVQHTYTEAGNFTAQLRVTNDQGRESSDSTTIAVRDPNIYEAEDADLHGPVVENEHGGFSGTGYASFSQDHDPAERIVWPTVTVATAGTYELQFRYANNGGSGDRPLRVSVNDAAVADSLSFPLTGAWNTWQTVSVVVELAAGTHSVEVASTTGYGPNVDYLRLASTDEEAPQPRISIIRPMNGATITGAVTLEVNVVNWVVEASGRHWHYQVGGSASVPVFDLNPIQLDLAAGSHEISVWLVEDDHSEVDGTRRSVAVTVQEEQAPPPGGFLESDGLVVMEAEHATRRIATGTHAWEDMSDASAGGGLAVVANPNIGTNTQDALSGPRLSYDVSFNTPGTYYLWVRLLGPGFDADSLHAGFDGTGATLGGQGIEPMVLNQWAWRNEAAGARISFTVAEPGVHSVDIWMREDGTQLDRLLLTTDADFVPAGVGPDESDRELAVSVDPPVFVTAPQSPGATVVDTEATFVVEAVDPGGFEETTYTWTFGDGTDTISSGTTPQASHTYTAPGHYRILVRASNSAGTTLASFAHRVHWPLSAAAPTRSSPIIVGQAGRVWNTNHDNHTVTATDIAGLAVLFEVPVPEGPSSLAQAADGSIWVVSGKGNRITALDGSDGSQLHSIALNYGDRPVGIAYSSVHDRMYVTLEGTGQVLRINPNDGTVDPQCLSIGSWPRGMAIMGDGSRLFVTHFVSPQQHAVVSEINPASWTVARQHILGIDESADTESSGSGILNYIPQVTITPDGRRAWLPAKKDNVERGLFLSGLELTFENTVRTVMAPISLLTDGDSDLPAERFDFDDSDRASALEFSPKGDVLFNVLQGTDRLEVRNPYSNGAIMASSDVGRAPQGVVLDPDSGRVFVYNFLSRSLSVFDAEGIVAGTSGSITHLADISVVANEVLDPEVLFGKQIFYNASDPRMSLEGYISCASCHDAGGSDGRVWDFSDRGEGLRYTTELWGRSGTAHGRIHWSANFDEIQDFEHDIRGPFGGTGFMSDEDFNAGTRNQTLGDPKAGISPELDALAAYVTSLDKSTIPDSPYRNADGSMTEAAIRG